MQEKQLQVTNNYDVAQTLEQVIGQGAQRVNFVNNRFQNTLDALAPRRDRLFDNLAKYAGYQFSLDQIQKLKKQNRVAITMDLCSRKVQGLAAAIVKNIWDFSLAPIDGKRNTLLNAVEDLHIIDKTNSNWDYQFLQHIIYGLISDSCMEMKLKNDDDPLGRIGWELCIPGSFVYDPNWKTGLSKDLEFCFKYNRMTAQQIMALYPDKTENIKATLIGDLANGGSFDQPLITDLQDYHRSKTLNGLYDVIEYNYLELEEIIREVDAASGLRLPDTDDVELKKAFIQANAIKYENIYSLSMTERKAKIITICPNLLPDVALYDGYDIFQIQRLRFFPMAAERIVGEPRGIMDIIAPMQDAINKLVNNVQATMDFSAHGGGGVDPLLFNNDEEKMAEFKKRSSEPGYKFFTAPGAISNGGKNYFQQMPRSTVDGAMFTQLSNLLNNLNNNMIPLNPAAEGKSENAGEPGIVFNMKMQAIEQAQLVLMKNVESFLIEIGEGYVDAAKMFYSKHKRIFYKSNNEEIVINDIKMLDNGDVAIDNDMASIQKCRVIVALSPKSPNSKFTQRMTNIETVKMLQNDPSNNEELIAISQATILKTIDYDDETQKLIEEASKRRMQIAKMHIDNMLKPPQPQQPKPKPPTFSARFENLPPAAQQEAIKKLGLQPEQPQGQQPQGNKAEDALKQSLAPLQAGNQSGAPQAEQALQQSLAPLTAESQG